MGHIKYQNINGHTVSEKYDVNVTKVSLNSKNIVKIEIYNLPNLIELDLYYNCIKKIEKLEHLTQLQKLNLSYNQITCIEGLEHLTQLQSLSLSFNKITSIEKLEHLIQLQELCLTGNKITSIEGLEHLTQLQIFSAPYNQIEKIEGLEHLTQLKELRLTNNKIKKIEGLEHLTQLQRLYLHENKITSIEGLEHLTQLQYLTLDGNQITKIEGLEHLTQLQTLNLSYNQITEIPFTIMNLHNLTDFYYDHDKIQIDPIIRRFLNRNQLKSNKITIYNDSQNVHNSSINRSVSESIYKILDTSISFDMVLKDILHDNILTNLTKDSLIEYSNMEDVHSTLNVSFKEVLQSVWYIIKNHKDSDQIKLILNEEMKDSLCKCFTGRLSRLVNSLNGFDERVSIKISDSNEISNIIILVRNKYSNIEDQKREIIKELKERDYSYDIINEWLSYL